MPDPKRYEEFVGLVRLYTSQILAYIDALLLNRNDAEDLFQETCMVLWQKFDEFTPGHELSCLGFAYCRLQGDEFPDGGNRGAWLLLPVCAMH